MNIKAIVILLATLMGGGRTITAQTVSVTSDTLSTSVHFRQGYSTLELGFDDNARQLQKFIDDCLSAQQEGKVGRVRVTASASPEGSATMNERLAKNRARHIVDYLQPKMEGFEFEIEPRGVDYDYLAELVERSDMPYKEKTLDVLRNTPIWVIKDGKVVDGKKRQLENIAGGRAWWYMYEHFFPEMRNAGAHISCTFEEIIPAPEPEPQPQPESVIVPQPEPEPMPEPEPIPAPKEKKPWYIAARTNMLFDAALVPNVGVEIYLGNKWTVGGNWNYSWWKKDGNTHWYEQTYGGDFEVRKYFGAKSDIKPFTGHHFGVYYQMMTYDMETGHKGYQAAKWNYGGGISYGYAMPIGKRLNIDFSLGVGYIGGEYKEYIPIDKCYVWQATKKRRWVGPTKAEVSLVWLLGRGNVNPGYPRKGKKAALALTADDLKDDIKKGGER